MKRVAEHLGSTLACALAAASFCCGAEWQPPRIVKIEAADAWASLPLTYASWSSRKVGGWPMAILARPGDLLMGEKAIVPYLNTDGARLKLEREDGILRLGETVVSLWLSGGSKAWQWLEGASRQELSAIRFVSLGKRVPLERLPMLWPLAARSPHAGLDFEAVKGAPDVLALFEPRWLAAPIPAITEKPGATLPRLRQVECLILNIEDAREPTVFIKDLPKLRTLAILGWNPKRLGTLSVDNPAVRALWLSGGFANLARLKAPENLRELYLLGSKELSDITALERFPNLQILKLTGCEKLEDLEPLAGLRHLRWLGLPVNTTQEQVATIIRQHPDVKVVELLGCKKVKDLGVLKGLREPFAVVAVGDHDLEPLKGLKTLRFLGLDAEVFDEKPEKIREVQKALPQCVIAPCGICLGSGWILLLAATVAFAWAAKGSRSKRKSQARHPGQR